MFAPLRPSTQIAAFMLAFVAIISLVGSVWKLQNRVSALEKAQPQPQSQQSRPQSKSPTQSGACGQVGQLKFSIPSDWKQVNPSGCEVPGAAAPVAAGNQAILYQAPHSSFDAAIWGADYLAIGDYSFLVPLHFR
jgi:hypothetical protein